MTWCPIMVWVRCWGIWKRVLLCVARDSTTANVSRHSTNTGTVYFTNVMLCANENEQLTLFSVSFGAFECKSRSLFSAGLHSVLLLFIGRLSWVGIPAFHLWKLTRTLYKDLNMTNSTELELELPHWNFNSSWRFTIPVDHKERPS